MSVKKGKEYVIGAVVGGLLGAVTALLFAPKAGRELRADIKEGAQAVSEKTQQVAGEVSERTKQIVANVSGKTSSAAKTIRRQTSEWAGKAKGFAARSKADVTSLSTAAMSAEDAGEEQIAPVAATTAEVEESDKAVN